MKMAIQKYIGDISRDIPKLWQKNQLSRVQRKRLNSQLERSIAVFDVVGHTALCVISDFAVFVFVNTQTKE
jgi:hypothetical protein